MAELDIVIRGGSIVDGTAIPRYTADVGIRAGRIAEIGRIDPARGARVLDADGLIVVSDMSTGIWTFKMEGFQGWNGEQWGVPDVSSVQKWDQVRPRPVSER